MKKRAVKAWRKFIGLDTGRRKSRKENTSKTGKVIASGEAKFHRILKDRASMGISDEVEVATIFIDETTISAIKATIALLSQSSLTTIVLQWRQRNLSKSVLLVQSSCFDYFLVSVVIVLHWALPRKTLICDYSTWKTDDLMEIDVRRYPYIGSRYVDQFA